MDLARPSRPGAAVLRETAALRFAAMRLRHRVCLRRAFIPAAAVSSPSYNKRRTATAARSRNRARFWLETLEKVRERRRQKTCAIATRFAVDTLYGNRCRSGARRREIRRVGRSLVDLWDIESAILQNGARMLSVAVLPAGPQVPWTKIIKQVVKKPVLGVAGSRTPRK